MFVPLRKYKVTGQSMTPSLVEGMSVLASSLPYLFLSPKPGDLVVLKHPQKNISIVKRIVTIENKKMFLQGDNKLASTDSRTFGWVDKKYIIAKVIGLD